MKTVGLIGFVTLFIFALTPNYSWSIEASPTIQRKQAEQELKDGNFKDAYRLFQKLILETDSQDHHLDQDLQHAVDCLKNLGQVAEIDLFVESATQLHAKNWRLLASAAEIYLHIPHHGHMIAGQFQRGNHRGGEQLVNSLQRDRVRALQLFQQALPWLSPNDPKQQVADFYWKLVNALLQGRENMEAWRLHYLTVISTLPDYEEGYPHRPMSRGTPVDAQGNPLLPTKAERWTDATTDGQRWRWTLNQISQQSPRQRDKVMSYQANFYRGQLGVETLRFDGPLFRFGDTDNGGDRRSSRYALHTLSENETIARLATGIQRFQLPDEFNFIHIYQRIADTPRSAHYENSLTTLAEIFQNRRQYPRAAEYWKRSVEHRSTPYKNKRLQQITGNWGQFGNVMTQPAGKGATVEYTFRNGKQVKLTAYEIHQEKLLNDAKFYLRSNPEKFDGTKTNLHNIGYRLVQRREKKYIGHEVARWTLDLKPRANHFDRNITLQTPLQKAGAYLLRATMADGNVSSIILWVADTAIAKKQLSGKTLYFVADAVTGRPIADANIEFFGFRRKHILGNRYQVQTSNFAERTNNDGQVIPNPRDLRQDHQWVAIARTASGRLAYLGFSSIWGGEYYDAKYQATKAVLITDRPVYRPEQTVHFKTWVRHAKYDMQDISSFAGKTFSLEIKDPQGTSIFKHAFTADEYGGFAGELRLADDAMLGQYTIHLPDTTSKQSGGTFRVEEYKKPEYEVTINAPSDPVLLGEIISATINARYYFGSPVTQAKVKYKITRTTHDQPQGDLGLVLRIWVLVVRIQLPLVSRLEQLGGLPAALTVVVATPAHTARSRGRAGSRNWY